MAAKTPALTQQDVQYIKAVTAPDYIVSTYPSFAALAAIPEVSALLTEGASNQWTQDQFLGHLMGTNWWKTNSDTQRKWQALELGDPAEANRQRFQKDLDIVEQAGTLGVTLSHEQIAALGNDAMAQGWDDNTLRLNMLGYAQPGKNVQPGLLEDTQTQLRNIAAAQGLNASDSMTWDWSKKINTGMADQKGFSQWAQQQAATDHPYWEKQINQGITVRQLADPYIQQASQLLEVSPDSINLGDTKKWDFTQTDKQGQATPMSQQAWANKIMSDPQYGWDRTENAKQSAFQVTDQLRQTFGSAL